MDRRNFIVGIAALVGASATTAASSAAGSERVPVNIDVREATGPLNHVWEESAGSDRAAITLRESWRLDLDRWRNEAGLKRVRFHGIFSDEVGVFAPSILSRGKATPNFRNVFEAYDGLVERGMAPFVEVGFMPKALASGTNAFGFYNANVPPRKASTTGGCSSVRS